jgi:arylsulfatase B
MMIVLAWLACDQAPITSASAPVGLVDADATNALPARVVDGPGPLGAVTITGPTTGLRDLRCSAADLRAGAMRFSWTVDGAPGPEGPVVPATSLTPRSRWTCTVSLPGTEPRTSAPYLVPTPVGGNVLLVVLDDLGIDKVARYRAHPDALTLPTLEGLMDRGVWFQTAYATPACSTSRSALLTGRHGRRTGFRQSLREDLEQGDYALPDDEVTVAELVQGHDPGWSTGAVGKWHLASSALFSPGAVLDQGFERFLGTKGNVKSYAQWPQVASDADAYTRHGYLTTAEVDDTLAELADRPEPWLQYVAFHAPHGPLEAPPPVLQRAAGATVVVTDDSDPVDVHAAMLAAADFELGRLLDGLFPEVLARTTVILLGDNGTSSEVVQPPLQAGRAKLTVYEGGVRVPLVVAGPAVVGPGRRSDALVSITDVFPTVADLAGVPLTDLAGLGLPGADGSGTTLDGVSLLPLLADPAAAGGHAYLFAERGADNGTFGPSEALDVTVRDQRWKLVHTPRGDELYALSSGLDEGEDLLAAGALEPSAVEALADLRAELDRLDATYRR